MNSKNIIGMRDMVFYSPELHRCLITGSINNSDGKKEDKETMGIPSISCFKKFGVKIFERFIYQRYLKSDVYRNEGSLSQFKLILNKEFEYVYTEDSYYSQIGGNFV